MTDYSTAIVAPLARWSCRIALFSASVLFVSLLLHRFMSLPTPVAMNLFAVGYAGLAVATLIGIAAFVQIWRTGFGGAASVAAGLILPLVVLAGPAGYVIAYHNLPRINDVTTDVASPPKFVVLAKRPEGTNSSTYPGARFAELQTQGYPDLRTLVLERPAEDAFELVEEAARKLRWRVVAAEPPTGRPGKAGTLEATEQTLIVGFADDIVVRVEGSPSRARIDVRSASRYGSFDFGQNATRVRRFLAEVQSRAEATSTGVAGRRGAASAGARALLKRQKAGDPEKAGSRTGRGPAQSNAPRAPAQKERQR